MRSFLVALALVALCGVSAQAGMVRVPLLNGVYSVEAPAEWYVKQEDDGTGVTFTPEKGAPAMVLITAPNLDVGDEIGEYAGVEMGLLFKNLGAGEITGEEEGKTDGYPSIAFSFSIPANGTTLEGRANVVNYNGAAVMFIVLAPADILDEFLPIAAAIIDSYQVHPEAIKEQQDVVKSVSDKINARIKEDLAK